MSVQNAVNDLANGKGLNPLVLGAGRPPVALATGDTIDTRDGMVRFTTAGAVTGILMRAGEHVGQVCVVINQSANTITMAAVGTSLVRNGVTTVIRVNMAAVFIWDGTNWNSLF